MKLLDNTGDGTSRVIVWGAWWKNDDEWYSVVGVKKSTTNYSKYMCLASGFEVYCKLCVE